MPTYGQRPEDVIQDSRGNALSGVAVKVYTSEALANAGGTPLETLVTDTRGRWRYVSAGGEVWARLPDGEVWQVNGAISAASDHGSLSGLADDDHPQYHTDARGDARYYTQAQVTTSLAGKAASVHTHVATDVTDSTATGRSVLTAASAAAARTAIGAGTSNLAVGVTGSDAKAGNYAPTWAEVTGKPTVFTPDPTAAQTINAQAGTTYTLVAADAGKLVTLTNAAAITLTVPASVFSAGQRIDCVVMGAGMATVTASGTTVNGTPSLVSRAQYSAFTIVCTASNTFVVIGDLA